MNPDNTSSLIREKVNKEWTLFLDRDGVINKRLIQCYVQSWEQFVFLEGVLEAIPVFNQIFRKLFIVTNQRGIGRGLMTEEELKMIHTKMLSQIELKGGQVHDIFYCAKLYDEIPNCRKPEPQMAFWAKGKNPEIDFEKSIMIGDQPGDILFGMNLNMFTVWIPNDMDIEWEEKSFQPDLICSSLYEFAKIFE